MVMDALVGKPIYFVLGNHSLFSLSSRRQGS